MYRIAVLLTCHNRKAKTIVCLENLYLQALDSKAFSLDVFLVDDGSSDGTWAAVKASFPKVNLIKGNGNLFWNRGMHLAWEHAKKSDADYYLWLNDDTFLYPNAIAELLESAKETNNQAIICGCIESESNTGEIAYGGLKIESKDYALNYPDGYLDTCDIIHGNCVIVPRFVHRKIGNLDPKFSHAIGDHDYSLRAKKQHIKSYSTKVFIAKCNHEVKRPAWSSPKVNIIARFKHLYSPLSYCPPIEFFIFEKRHFGFWISSRHLLSIHLKAIVPSLWTRLKKNSHISTSIQTREQF